MSDLADKTDELIQSIDDAISTLYKQGCEALKVKTDEINMPTNIAVIIKTEGKEYAFVRVNGNSGRVYRVTVSDGIQATQLDITKHNYNLVLSQGAMPESYSDQPQTPLRHIAMTHRKTILSLLCALEKAGKDYYRKEELKALCESTRDFEYHDLMDFYDTLTPVFDDIHSEKIIYDGKKVKIVTNPIELGNL